MGLCPTVYQSGDSLRHGRMKKRDVNRNLTWIMIQVANVAVMHDDYLKGYFERVKKAHGGNHKMAITHVANKMVKMAWAMLRKNEVYKYRNDRLYQSKLARLDRAMYSDKVQKTKG